MTIDEINKHADDLMREINFQLLNDEPLAPKIVFALADLHKHLVNYDKIVNPEDKKYTL
jgi:hypothetical protein